MIIFISDLHLRSRGCKTKRLLNFLQNINPTQIYLVGDIIDLWVPNNWNTDCNEILNRLLEFSSKGTEVIYLTGNHDSPLRRVTPLGFGNIQIIDECIVELGGKKYLLIHGDKFDLVHEWISILGGLLYDVVLWANDKVNDIRRILGKETHWSFAAFIKKNTKQAMNHIQNYKLSLLEYAYNEGCDGVICGHIHTPEISQQQYGGRLMDYINCGDWVENCTAVIYDGSFKLERF